MANSSYVLTPQAKSSNTEELTAGISESRKKPKMKRNSVSNAPFDLDQVKTSTSTEQTSASAILQKSSNEKLTSTTK